MRGRVAPATGKNMTTAPRNFTQPQEIRFGELPGLIAEAEAAGFCAVRMRVIKLGYRVEFQRQATTPTTTASGFATLAGLNQPD